VLANAAAAAGLWPWFTPDGTLVVGRPPDSTGAFPVARLELGPRRSNVLDLARRQSMHSRFSEVTVLGQGPGTHTDVARTALWDRAVDTGVQYHRPRIVVDHESESTAMCRARARKVIADARLSSYDLVARVARHRIHAPGTSSDGLLWTPGQRVHVVSAPHRIDGVFFVMARRFSGGREHGAVTTLTLKEDGVWQIDAHPHQRRYRRGRNAIAGNIEDAPA
jgi:prophage tail gpP-like protein